MTDRDRLGADSLREIREECEGILVGLGCDQRVLAGWVLALVAEREALLERIQELEDGGHGSAVSRGEVAGVSPFRQPKLQEIP